MEKKQISMELGKFRDTRTFLPQQKSDRISPKGLNVVKTLKYRRDEYSCISYSKNERK